MNIEKMAYGKFCNRLLKNQAIISYLLTQLVILFKYGCNACWSIWHENKISNDKNNDFGVLLTTNLLCMHVYIIIIFI